MAEAIDRSNTTWFKDAVIYQVHIKSFYDSNGDGYGDIPGLIEKLDYIQDLGIDTIWLLPFYPSPLRDDGYDIADYEGINPVYGNMDDCKRLLDEAHKRGLRVITELVINHTSDQHPWFQAARRAPIGSVQRDFYVWSETDKKYEDTRIIFVDTEKSNWTWDELAGAYYWHRFFHHQPDLNYDNPAVFKAVTETMLNWLDLGVDGLRLDAIPYLVERDGTNCENLPETHDVLKRMRAVMDKRHSDRIFLAEANQWPSDVCAYFGDGDECHMAFHFPVMPRLFMALHQEDRHPITDILRQTPPIPENCQWAMFLRNHDELTLEMVTNEERDYMYKAYAEHPLMKVNVGIRRRLAPLLEHSRPRIELLNSLLFSMPGTPIVYYGDEIGMGENIYLDDRNGVRTPMQWNADRNAGFSKALFAQLYSPPIMDPVTGYQSVNVEAQQLDPSSLLNWMKNAIKLRKRHKVFGRGTLEILTPENRKILAYLRRHENEVILCVANLSRHSQSASLDLSQFAGAIPVEMFGLGAFHPVKEEPYILTLGPYQFYWLMLSFDKESLPAQAPAAVEKAAVDKAAAAGGVDEGRAPMGVLSIKAKGGWSDLLSGSSLEQLEARLLPVFLSKQRWFGKKSETITSVSVVDWASLPSDGEQSALVICQVQTSGGSKDLYAFYLALAGADRAEKLKNSGQLDAIVGQAECGDETFVIYEAVSNEDFCRQLLQMVANNEQLKLEDGKALLAGGQTRAFGKLCPADVSAVTVKRIPSEQSNSSVIFGENLILKLYRRIHPGVNPDFELGLFLRDHAAFSNTPQIAGVINLHKGEQGTYTLGLLQEFITNQGDGWTYTIEEFRRFYERANTHMYLIDQLDRKGRSLIDLVDGAIPRPAFDLLGIYITEAETLGRRTGEMHVALASEDTDPRFKPEPISAEELKATAEGIKSLAKRVIGEVGKKSESLSKENKALAAKLAQNEQPLLNACDKLLSMEGKLMKIRCHGDFHLGQVLDAFGDWILFDFEGEPSRPLEIRSQKHSPLKDVAGMLRSYSYAAYASLFVFTHNKPEDLHRFLPWAKACETWVQVSFLKGYLNAVKQQEFIPQDRHEFFEALQPYIIDKAFYEIDYELNNRPDWLGIPLASVAEDLESGALIKENH